MAIQPVRIVNQNFNDWYDAQNSRNDARDAATVVLLVAMLAQLLLYYNGFVRNLNRRDDEIDKVVDFLQWLQDRKHGSDLDMLREKQGVLDLPLPPVDMCGDAVLLAGMSRGDGEAVDETAARMVNEACGGLPNGWRVHEGALQQAASASNAGGLLANAAKREQEWFRYKKNRLVAAAQQNAKAPFSANSILARYVQSMSIYSGLTDLYVQGFNSAGAGLGVLLGRMSNGTTGSFSGSHSTTGTTYGGQGDGR